LPSRALRPCKDRDCTALTNDKTGYCPEHIMLVEEFKKQQWREQDKHRDSSHKRGYDSTWEKLRKVFLRENPLCHDCIQHERITPAKEVHHIKKVREYPSLRLVKDNLMGLCKSCHSSRTAKGE